MQQPRLIAFEGVDGAGKSSVLERVARLLRARGERVFLPRSGKQHASRPTRGIRDFTRDAAHLDLTPRAELALYCAREAQVLEELVRPALARGETVLMDRSALTGLVLGAFGRGLDRQLCETMTHAATGGHSPDLTLIFDVQPGTSRLRKHIDKIRGQVTSGGGRKGLAGSSLPARLRAGYLAVAAEHQLPVFHAERASAEVVAERVVAYLERGVSPLHSESPADAQPVWQVPTDWSLEQGLASVPREVALYLSAGLVAGRDVRRKYAPTEPALVAWSLDAEDPLFGQCVEHHPEHAASRRVWPAAGGLDAPGRRLLELHPSAFLNTLRGRSDTFSDGLRSEYAESAPDAVLASLAGRSDAVAEELRTRVWAHASLQSRAISSRGCDGVVAWRRRRELFEEAPHFALASLLGVCCPSGDELLRRYADKAEKLVLAALVGRKDPVANELRWGLLRAGREVLESIAGLADDTAWQLRERLVASEPAAALFSLRGLPDSPRRRSLRQSAERLGAGDLHVLQRSRELDEQATAGPARPEATGRACSILGFEEACIGA